MFDLSESECFYRIVKGKPVVQVMATFISNLNALSSGVHYSWTSPYLPKILSAESDIEVTNRTAPWITIILLCGGFIGSIISIFILDKMGRKAIIMLAAAIYFLSWLLITLGTKIEVVLTARFFAGLADGLTFNCIPIYVGEISQPNIRGFLGSMSSVFFLSGILLINIIGSYLSIFNAGLISLTVPLLLLILFPIMPESPYCHIVQNNVALASKSLKLLRGRTDVTSELNRITEAVQEQMAHTGKYLDLFTVKSNRKALGIKLGVCVVQQLTGVTPIMFYAQTIFKEAGGSFPPAISAIIYFSLQLIVSILGTTVVDRIGRKPLVLVSLIGSGITMMIVACYFYIQQKTNFDTTGYSLIPLIGLIIYVIVFSIGLQNYPILLIGELFPANVKAFAVSLSSIFFSMLIGSVSQFFYFTKEAYGIYVPFFVFSISSIIGLMFVIYFVPETKCKTLEDIQEDLKEA